MSDTTTPADLTIPDASARAAYYAYGRAQGWGRDTEDMLSRVLAAAAPGIVAAELRRIAADIVVREPRPGEFGEWDRGWGAARDMILARADELDGGAQ